MQNSTNVGYDCQVFMFGNRIVMISVPPQLQTSPHITAFPLRYQGFSGPVQARSERANTRWSNRADLGSQIIIKEIQRYDWKTLQFFFSSSVCKIKSSKCSENKSVEIKYYSQPPEKASHVLINATKCWKCVKMNFFSLSSYHLLHAMFNLWSTVKAFILWHYSSNGC